MDSRTVDPCDLSWLDQVADDGFSGAGSNNGGSEREERTNNAAAVAPAASPKNHNGQEDQAIAVATAGAETSKTTTSSARSTWNPKSLAARTREYVAMKEAERFFSEAATQDNFPYEREVVPPYLHLTAACYKTFRRYVMAHGCIVKRRKLTPEQRMELPKKCRHPNNYSISLKFKVHPSIASDAQQVARAAYQAKKMRLKAKQQRFLIAMNSLSPLAATAPSFADSTATHPHQEHMVVVSPNTPGAMTTGQPFSQVLDSSTPSYQTDPHAIPSFSHDTTVAHHMLSFAKGDASPTPAYLGRGALKISLSPISGGTGRGDDDDKEGVPQTEV